MAKNITVVGLGYVGLTTAICLAEKNHVTGFDINSIKVNLLKRNKCPFGDPFVEEHLSKVDINFTDKNRDLYEKADFVVVALPTDYDEKTKSFNTLPVEIVVENALSANKNSIVVIRSTLPIGFTLSLNKRYRTKRIIYVPEFLKETTALQDALTPSRIVIGADDVTIGEKYKTLVNRKDVPIMLVETPEAEAIKLFSNAYLANRIAFFNELDTFANEKGLHTDEIIKGMGYDPRIGDYYNKPSIGFGGYCLPKDTKQLETCYENIPNRLIKSIVESNEARKDYIVRQILNKLKGKKNPKVGVNRLVERPDSDNYRNSPKIDIINRLIKKGVKVYVYEPLCKKLDGCYLIARTDLKNTDYVF